jgi:SWI/SNF-related matrix-associated actin-dependent regulator of chromatin subfamily A3
MTSRALLVDLLPFSQINPASANFIPGVDPEEEVKTQATGGTIGFQPVAGEIVKSVVFSQWTKLLDRYVLLPPRLNLL